MANTVDIAPELLEAITKEIQEAVEKDPVLQKVLQSIEDGTVTSADMYKYAERYGEIEADALSKYLTEENLPNGRLYQNIAERTVTPTMRDAEQNVNHVAAEIQTAINKGAGLNIKGVEADVDMDHIEGITKKLSYSESIDRVSYLLRDPMVTTLMHAVDRTIQKNVDLHAEAGLNPVVKRISVGGCCEWCQERAGTYDYIEDDLWNHGTEVYRRHNFCRCLVAYNPMDGKGWQNVHHQQDWGNLRELSGKEEARRQARIETEKEIKQLQFKKASEREREYERILLGKYKKIDTKYGEEANEVDFRYVKHNEYKKLFQGITGDKSVDNRICQECRGILKDRSGTEYETLVLLDYETGKRIAIQHGVKHSVGTYTEQTIIAIKEAKQHGRKIIAIHNHPYGYPPSISDSASALTRGYDLGVVCGHNGNVYTYGPSDRRFSTEQCKKIHNEMLYATQNEETTEKRLEEWMKFFDVYGCKMQQRG